jgi:hypothetical protein
MVTVDTQKDVEGKDNDLISQSGQTKATSSFSDDILSPRQDLNSVPPEYKAMCCHSTPDH